MPFFVGAGAYKHHVPATVDHLIQRSEFLTSYTPYQPEIAQGTLQYLFEFQTQVAMLTGMEVANASMYDGSTAAAEAVLMAHRVTRRHKAVLAGNLHPHYRETIETVARLAGHEIVALPPAPGGKEDLGSRIDGTVSCVVVQNAGLLRPAARSDTELAETGACRRRAADRRRDGGRVARPGASRRAPWAPTSSSARANRSATRSPSAAPTSACSPRARSTCGRCRGGCAARPWTRRAGAASC